MAEFSDYLIKVSTSSYYFENVQFVYCIWVEAYKFTFWFFFQSQINLLLEMINFLFGGGGEGGWEGGGKKKVNPTSQ